MRALLVIGIAILALVTLVIATAPAEAGCASSSVCYTSGGRRVCRSETACVAPRRRVCTWDNRCTPQRTCVSTPGRSSCVYRDVCRRVEVCN